MSVLQYLNNILFFSMYRIFCCLSWLFHKFFSILTFQTLLTFLRCSFNVHVSELYRMIDWITCSVRKSSNLVNFLFLLYLAETYAWQFMYVKSLMYLHVSNGINEFRLPKNADEIDRRFYRTNIHHYKS